MLESGVSRYIVATATVEVNFPVDFRGNPHVSCSFCDLFSKTSGRCPLTHAISEFPDKYVGSHCPLVIPTEDPLLPPPGELARRADRGPTDTNLNEGE